jgi:hypothetical protein
VDRSLSRLLSRGSIPNSLLLVGNSQEKLKQEVLAFAQTLLGIQSEEHPDLLIMAPQGKTAQYSVESLRQFKDEVYKTPYVAQKKVFILLDAERMPPVSANALLKAFEEPLLTSHIILCTVKPELLLPTVLSRCQKIYLCDHEKVATLPKPYIEILRHIEKPTPGFQLARIEELVTWMEMQADLSLEFAEGEEEAGAYQKEQAEKKREGVRALKLSQMLNALLLAKLYWVRDLHLLSAKGPETALFFRQETEQLQQQILNQKLPSLEQTEAQVKRAMASFERSTPLSHVLFDFLIAEEIDERAPFQLN